MIDLDDPEEVAQEIVRLFYIIARHALNGKLKREDVVQTLRDGTAHTHPTVRGHAVAALLLLGVT